MTIQELRDNYIKYNPDGLFFDYEMLKRYGESISRMRVTGKGVLHTRNCGDVICYEVLAQQKKVTGIKDVRYYFDVDTFAMMIPA